MASEQGGKPAEEVIRNALKTIENFYFEEWPQY
jgi:hypothetical protein